MAKDAREVFSFIAGHLQGFLQDEHSDRLRKRETMNLGFCFAFPVDQKSVNSGTLLRWTKGFDIEDAVGKDVCELLQNEIDDLNLPVRVTAIVNDTLGTIIARAFTLPVSQTRTSIGAIFGMGTNAAYLEKLSKIKKDIGEHDSGTGAMFLNIEWGSFDNELKVLPKTWYDQQIDEASVNPGSQMFEKRISSMFLGELLRLAIEKMYDDPKAGLFPNFRRGDKTLPLRTKWSVDTSIMSIAETDLSIELETLRKKIEGTFGLPSWAVTKQDAQVVRKISQAIGRRAARLSGMAVAAVVHQSGKLDEVDPLTLPASDTMRNNSNGIDESRMVDVAVDGTVYELYPHFEEYMREALEAIEQIGPEGEQRIRIGLTKDGASIGTAIIALLASQQKEHIDRENVLYRRQVEA